MTNMNKIFLSVCLTLYFLPAGAQQLSSQLPLPTPDTTSPVREKIFVHTDKDFYLAGEILWFKLYVVEAASHRPIDLSKLAYVEVLSKEQRPVLQGKIALSDGAGNGSFQLPFSIHSGNYIVRAYTNWMKNAGPQLYFEKTITIFNSLKNADTISSANPPAASPPSTNPSAAPPPSATALEPSYDLQFFPEGGNLVKGLPNRVAFRIADRSGHGLPATGSLLDDSGHRIAELHTLHGGMGQFSFTPGGTSPYKVVLELEDHHLASGLLMPATENGYTMQADDTTDGRLKIAVSIPSPVRPEDSLVWLIVRSGPSFAKAAMENISGGTATFLISKNELQDGVSQLTILNAKKTPVCERLWFNYPPPLNLDLQVSKENFAPREMIGLDLSAHDAGGSPVEINGSIAVVLQDSLQSDPQENIRTYLLLSSDLRGTVDSPEYYFSDNSSQVQTAMDLLMRVQGWRKIQVSAPSANPNSPEYAGILVTGKITNRITGAAAGGIPVWLSAPGEKFSLAHAVSNKDGLLQWDMGKIYGASELVVQTGNPVTDSLYRIDLSPAFSEPVPQKNIPPFRLPAGTRDQLLLHSIGAQAQNAYQPDRFQHFVQPLLADTGNFYGYPDVSYLLDDYTRFTTMEEVMREYIRQVRVRNNNGNFSFYAQSDQANEIFFESSPLVLLDGVPISDMNKIIQFDPLKIRRIEIMTKRYLLDDSIFQGIINYSTYKGDLAGFLLDRNVSIQEFEGLQVQRQFYSPVYETEDQRKSRIPDLRNVLFWSPEVLTGHDGKKHLSFSTSDFPGRYMILIQCITSDGRMGFGRKFISLTGIGPAH
jgi:hypothetical protein